MDELPAGDYFLTQQSVINAVPMVTFSLGEGERKSISLSEAAVKSQRAGRGFLIVRPYSADGLPLPGCEVILTGAKGEVPRQTTQSAHVSFVTEPGPYRLSVSYPGFAPVTKQVEVKGTQNGRWGTDHQLDVTLVRSTEQTKTEIR